jgi:hypothetical protein
MKKKELKQRIKELNADIKELIENPNSKASEDIKWLYWFEKGVNIDKARILMFGKIENYG